MQGEYSHSSMTVVITCLLVNSHTFTIYHDKCLLKLQVVGMANDNHTNMLERSYVPLFQYNIPIILGAYICYSMNGYVY